MLGIFTGPLFFFVGVGILYILVPKKGISRFWGMGLVGGLGLALVLTYLMHNVFGYWSFFGGDIALAGMPLFLSAAWIPLVILYCYWTSQSNEFYQIALAIGVFAFFAAVVHWYYLRQGMLVYVGWNVLYTFTLSLIIHAALYYYLYVTKRLGEFQQS
ncbi:MAG: hypothetical protein H6Q71_13 [Firmicutes bacterium]|nr:hypothetical protein [Bacillota bacterium]